MNIIKDIPGLKHYSVAGREARQIIVDRRDGNVHSIATPWQKLNQKYLLDGFEWGTFLTLAGMSSSGKTAVATQFMADAHDLNPDEVFLIVFWSFEMTGAKLVLRNIIKSTSLQRETLLSSRGQHIEDYQLAVVDRYLESIKDKMIYLWEKPVTAEEYSEILRKIYERTGIKIISIGDHSVLFKSKKAQDKEREVLVNLALDIMEVKNEMWSIHILLSQLNREIEKPERRMPKSPLNYPGKGDVFASDALFWASDYVMVIHRPYLLKFVGNTYGPEGLSAMPQDCYFHIIKNREDDIGICKMQADFKNMKILDA